MVQQLRAGIDNSCWASSSTAHSVTLLFPDGSCYNSNMTPGMPTMCVRKGDIKGEVPLKGVNCL